MTGIMIDGKPLGASADVPSTHDLPKFTGIEYLGTQYVIIKPNPAKYRILRADGKLFNLPRHAPVTIFTPSEEFLAAAREVAYGGTSRVMVSPDAASTFKEGTPVRIVGTRGKWNNVEGLICKVNPTKFKVVVAHQGIVNVPHGMVQAI